MKILITENQMRKLEFKYLDYLFGDMYEVESAKYKHSKFWKKDDEVMLELEKSGEMRVPFSIWRNISNMFSLDYDETKQLIKDWVEQHLELEGITPDFRETYDFFRWKNI